MRKRGILLLILAILLPCAAALADPEEWEYHVTDEYTIRYPDYIRIYGVPEEETGWNMEVFEDPEDRETTGVPVMTIILRAGADDWTEWLETGAFPDEQGHTEPMRRMAADEPPVDLHTGLETRYALFISDDGTRMTEAFVFDPEEGDTDYVVLCRFPANDGGWYSDVQHWMIETITFTGAEPEPGAPALSGARGSFYVTADNWEYDGTHEVIRDVTVEKDALSRYFIFVTSEVKNFRAEKLTWDDRTFKISKVRTLYSAKELNPRNVIAVWDWIPEIFPNVRIQAVNANGDREVWYISASGEDGSMILLSEEETVYNPE